MASNMQQLTQLDMYALSTTVNDLFNCSFLI